MNLERPLSLQTRLSGHIVQGHVDGTGTLESLRELGDGNWELLVRVPAELDRLLVYKGSIAIDGISLTIASLQRGGVVKVAIIPHTYEATNLVRAKAGRPRQYRVRCAGQTCCQACSEHMTLPGRI